MTWELWYRMFEEYLQIPCLEEQTEEKGDYILQELNELILITRYGENRRKEMKELYRFFWCFFSSFSERSIENRKKLTHYFANSSFFFQMIQILYLSTTFEMYLEELFGFFTGIPDGMEEDCFYIKVYMFPFLPGDVQVSIMGKLKERLAILPYSIIENGLFGGMIEYCDFVGDILLKEIEKRDKMSQMNPGKNTLTQCRRGNPVYLLISLYLYERIPREELFRYSEYFTKIPYLGYAADPKLYFFQIYDSRWKALFSKNIYLEQQRGEKLRSLKEYLVL